MLSLNCLQSVYKRMTKERFPDWRHSPLDILRAVTTNAAEMLGWQDHMGAVEIRRRLDKMAFARPTSSQESHAHVIGEFIGRYCAERGLASDRTVDGRIHSRIEGPGAREHQRVLRPCDGSNCKHPLSLPRAYRCRATDSEVRRAGQRASRGARASSRRQATPARARK
jgi:hypothetical protein